MMQRFDDIPDLPRSRLPLVLAVSSLVFCLVGVAVLYSYATRIKDRANEATQQPQNEDVRMEVTNEGIKTISAVPFSGDDTDVGQLKTCLQIKVTIRNNSANRLIPYKSLIGDARVSLKDEFGNSYRQIHADAAGKRMREPPPHEIHPSIPAEEHLCFVPPVAAATSLTLELPGESVGRTKPFLFKIPFRHINSP